MRMSRNRKDENIIKGHPLTNQRRLLLDILRNTEGHVDAKNLYRLAIAKDTSISQATIYRSLKLFKELGLIDEMTIDRLRCVYQIKQSEEHQHLICQGCGKIIEISTPYFQELIKKIQSENSFIVTKVDLHLHGYCTKCEEKTRQTTDNIT